MKLEQKIAVKAPMLGSSADPNKVSLTVKGIVVGLIPLAVVLLKQLDIEVTADSLLELVELGLAAASAVMVFIGAVRKVVKSIN